MRALRAVRRPSRVERVAIRARAGRAALVDPDQSLDRAQLRVELLQPSGLAGEKVHAEEVADRHLVSQAAEVELELSELAGQLALAVEQLGGRDRAVAAGW